MSPYRLSQDGLERVLVTDLLIALSPLDEPAIPWFARLMICCMSSPGESAKSFSDAQRSRVAPGMGPTMREPFPCRLVAAFMFAVVGVAPGAASQTASYLVYCP